MDLEQQQDENAEVWMDVSQHVPTGDLYAIQWDRASGQMRAIAGPISLEDAARLNADALEWRTGDEDLVWAKGQYWRQESVLRE